MIWLILKVSLAIGSYQDPDRWDLVKGWGQQPIRQLLQG